MSSFVLTVIAALAFGVFFVRRLQTKRAAIAERRADFEGVIKSVLNDVTADPVVTVGVESWRGTWNGERVQVRTIVDTLATRKLPALWLSVTVNEAVNTSATIDIMARPNSATTFSNFELLPHGVKSPEGFPEFAAIRTDKADAALPFEILGRHVGIFNNGRTKELLITPNGVRIVVLAAEADRARYGVFRQADFSGFKLDGTLIEDLVKSCSSLRADINKSYSQVAA